MVLIKNIINKGINFQSFLGWFLSSFERGTEGASQRKIIAYFFSLITAYIEISFVNCNNFYWVITGNLVFILLILQIVKAHDVTEFINKKDEKPTDPIKN